jgi:hypothetical protein
LIQISNGKDRAARNSALPDNPAGFVGNHE